MEKKVFTEPGQRRTRRPDLAAEAEHTPDAEVVTPPEPPTEGADVAPADLADVDDADVADADEQAAVTTDNVTVRSDFIEGSGPYLAKGVQVVDAGGRQVCMVASGHLAAEKRHEIAAWIAQKLNA